MFVTSTPFEVAAVVVAAGWSVAAGLMVVLWSKARAAARARREAALEGELKGLYRSVAARPAPDQLLLVVEALEEAQEMAQRPAEAPPKSPQPVG